jgi:predicted ATPase
LTIAQQQQARWWELRAATTLAKHWHDEGKYLEAYSLLQPVYGSFVEGFDTASLKDAEALLGELRDLSGPQIQARRG